MAKVDKAAQLPSSPITPRPGPQIGGLFTNAVDCGDNPASYCPGAINAGGPMGAGGGSTDLSTTVTKPSWSDMHSRLDLGARWGANRRVVPSRPQASIRLGFRPPQTTRFEPADAPWLTIRAQDRSQENYPAVRP